MYQRANFRTQNKMTDVIKGKNDLFFSIFLTLLRTKVLYELNLQNKIQEQIAEEKEDQLIRMLANIEPEYKTLPLQNKLKQISDVLHNKYQERYQMRNSKLSKLDFFRNITASRLMHYSQINRYTKNIYPPFNQGACTAIPMSVLMQYGNNPLRPLLLNTKAAWVDPKLLMQHLKQAGYGNCLYETSQEYNFQKIFDKHQVKKGAFIIIDLDKPIQDTTAIAAAPNFEKLERGHTMIYVDDNPSKEPLYHAFDDNQYYCPLRQKWQCGYVIDWQKIAALEAQKSRDE